ncbi:MAG: hypothetical protein ACRYG8_01045 [Janthinobacterium lividum]
MDKQTKPVTTSAGNEPGTKVRFWGSVAGLFTLLTLIIDTQINGLMSLPLSIAEVCGAGIYMTISTLSVRPNSARNGEATPENSHLHSSKNNRLTDLSTSSLR